MNIGILSRNRELYSTRAIAKAARRRGHTVSVVDYLRCHMNITSKDPRIYLGRRELDEFDAIVPRIGAQHTFFGTAVVRQFEMMGVYSLNESVAISRARDKLRCLQLLARKGLGEHLLLVEVQCVAAAKEPGSGNGCERRPCTPAHAHQFLFTESVQPFSARILRQRLDVGLLEQHAGRV